MRKVTCVAWTRREKESETRETERKRGESRKGGYAKTEKRDHCELTGE
jgi:hypothetical protein